MAKKIEIKKVNAEDILDLRQRVLRPGKARADAVYPADESLTTFHLAAFVDGVLCCTATFIKEDHAVFKEINQYRLRGMATAADYRNQGLGRAILEEAYVWLRRQGCHFLWCYAREVAFDFYVKLGFSFEGDFFNINEIGLHKIMFRKI